MLKYKPSMFPYDCLRVLLLWHNNYRQFKELCQDSVAHTCWESSRLLVACRSCYYLFGARSVVAQEDLLVHEQVTMPTVIIYLVLGRAALLVSINVIVLRTQICERKYTDLPWHLLVFTVNCFHNNAMQTCKATIQSMFSHMWSIMQHM